MEIAEGDITKIKVGSKVEYSILSEPNRKFHAQISSIDPGLTTLSNGKYKTTSSSGSTTSSSSSSAIYYYAKAVVDNPDGTLRIGMTTQNTVILDSAKDAVIVPSIAVKNEEGKSVVYVLKRDKNGLETAERREVQTGLIDSLKTQILNATGKPPLKLPSTSSANANFSFERLVREWTVVVEALKDG